MKQTQVFEFDGMEEVEENFYHLRGKVKYDESITIMIDGYRLKKNEFILSHLTQWEVSNIDAGVQTIAQNFGRGKFEIEKIDCSTFPVRMAVITYSVNEERQPLQPVYF